MQWLCDSIIDQMSQYSLSLSYIDHVSPRFHFRSSAVRTDYAGKTLTSIIPFSPGI